MTIKKTFLSIGVPVLVLMGLFTYISVIAIHYVSQTNQAKFNLIENVEIQVRYIEKWLDDQLSSIQTVALTAAPHLDNMKALEEHLQLATQGSANLNTLSFIDTSGIARATTVDGALGLNVSDRQYFKEAMKGQAVVTDIILGKVDNSPLLPAAAPLTVKGIIRGVVIAGLRIGTITEMIIESAADDDLRSVMFDSNGTVFADSNLMNIEEIGPVTGQIKDTIGRIERYRNSEGEIVLGTSEQIPGTKLFVLAELPLATVVAPARRFALILLGPISLVSIVVVLIFLSLSRNIEKPVVDVIMSTSRLIEGEYEYRIDVEHQKHFPVELQILCRQFNTMAETIEQNVEHLTRTKEELEHSNNDLQSFVYAASHDLQEPLRMVVSYLGLLERRMGEAIEGENKEFLNFAVDGALRMQDLLKALLEYSRLGSRFEPMESVDLNSVVDESVRRLGVLIAERNVEVHTGTLPQVTGDPRLLASVFQNLIQNSVKFNRQENPAIRIQGAVQGDEAVITYKDNGIGIPKEQWERVFTIFQRLHPRDQFSGTGVGLALVRRILDKHKGAIYVTDSDALGTEFKIYLPIPGTAGA